MSKIMELADAYATQMVHSHYHPMLEARADLQAEVEKLEALSQPVSMEPVGEAYLCEACETPFDGGYECPTCGHNTAIKDAVYTATQLAAARQQGAEEAYKDANMQTYKDAIKQVRKLNERIAELEQKNAVFLEALKRARDTAMKYTLVARIPECGHFGGIAQDLDYVYAAIAEVKP